MKPTDEPQRVGRVRSVLSLLDTSVADTHGLMTICRYLHYLQNRFFFLTVKIDFHTWVDDPSSFRCLTRSDFCMWIKRPHVKLDFRMRVQKPSNCEKKNRKNKNLKIETLTLETRGHCRHHRHRRRPSHYRSQRIHMQGEGRRGVVTRSAHERRGRRTPPLLSPPPE